MRVLYPLRYFPTLTETFVLNEAVGLAGLGEHVAIAALGDRLDGKLAPPVSLPVHRVPRRPLRGRLKRSTAAQRQVARWQRGKDAARLPWLRHLARDFDVLQVHFAGEAAELAWAVRQDGGPPYVVVVHAVDLFKPRPSFRRVLSDADAVVTVCASHQQRLAALGIDAAVVRCGPVVSDWATLPPPPGGPLRAVFVGRDVPKKGLETLLAAWAQVPSGASLSLVTDAESAVAGVEVLGLLPPAGVRQVLGRSNLLVLPCRTASDGDQDGVPLVLMEALAAARPVVTTPVSGIPELVDEAVGWLVPPDNPTALAAALREGHVHAEERARRGSRGPGRLVERRHTASEQVADVRAGLLKVCRVVACVSPDRRT